MDLFFHGWLFRVKTNGRLLILQNQGIMCFSYVTVVWGDVYANRIQLFIQLFCSESRFHEMNDSRATVLKLLAAGMSLTVKTHFIQEYTLTTVFTYQTVYLNLYRTIIFWLFIKAKKKKRGGEGRGGYLWTLRWWNTLGAITGTCISYLHYWGLEETRSL